MCQICDGYREPLLIFEFQILYIDSRIRGNYYATVREAIDFQNQYLIASLHNFPLESFPAKNLQK